jgi:hypothetical protein
VVGSSIVYAGIVLALIGVALILKPIGPTLVATGLVVVGIGMLLPAPESRVDAPRTRLDEVAPAWQFRERHEMVVNASPDRVFAAIKSVRADEILFFRALTWIRRGGRPAPESILNAGDSTPIIDIATRSGFARLAEEAPRELVVGTIVVRPPGSRVETTPEVFGARVAPGFALAAMNFLVAPHGAGGARVSTETRVYANGDGARRRFAMYWRLIYPGSALIRRMWLRAIERRAEGTIPMTEAR